jgi:MYXO-CTERM domain-containing protein
MLLQAANRLEANPRYVEVCSDQIAYLYGRNQYNRSYVTGAGIDPPLHPHHRISGSDDIEEPYPGLLVGGGQSATNWKDQQSDFSSNEIAINWNSALAYALAGFIQGEGATESLGRAPVKAEACEVRISSVGYVPEQRKVATIQRNCTFADPFQCALPETTLNGNTSGPASIIDDFEDGDLEISRTSGRQGAWSTFDDGTAGMHDEPTLTSGGSHDSAKSLCIRGGGYTDWGGAVTLNLNDVASRDLYDGSAYTGISFWARGSATQFRALVVDQYSDPARMLCSGCYDHFQAPFMPNDEWQQYRFSWKELKQQGFGDAQPHVCPATLLALNFEWSTDSEFELCLDDVAFTTAGDGDDAGVAGAGGEASSMNPKPALESSGGCGCRVGRDHSGSAASLLALFGLAATALRRRGRVRSA